MIVSGLADEAISIPKIEPVFGEQNVDADYGLYSEIIKNTLKRILGSNCKSLFHQCAGVETYPKALQDQFQALLPIVTFSNPQPPPSNISFYFLSKYRANAFKFFNDMINYWLVPGKRLNLVLIYAADFRFPEFGDQVYTLCEVMIRVEDQAELNEILRNLQIIETELRLGIEFGHYARKILEYKGIASDEKTAWMQEYIAKIIKRLPDKVDHDILTEMQHVLVTVKEDFKALRDARHLSRIITIHYVLRKSLREEVLSNPEKRFLALKLFRYNIQTRDGYKPVLCVLVGVNFFRDKEVFDKVHLLKAIQNYIPNAKAVENSFFSNRRGSEHLCMLYLEIEKGNHERFTEQEIATLREELPSDLKDRIQHLMYPVFMPRNEEEIIRNILSLSSQIKYFRDIPQVFISFDEQTHANLFFTIILVRVLKPEVLSIQDMFKPAKSFLEYYHDRVQIAGTLRKKYKKEATVFRVKLSKDPYIRRDHTIDLNKARHAVARELSRVVGEFRDFNGGMITKQNELFFEFSELLRNDVKYNDLLVENFFYSLSPVIMRSVLEPEDLKTLFIMLLDALEERVGNGQKHLIKALCNKECAFVLIKTEDTKLKEEIAKRVSKLQIHSSLLANAYVSIYDYVYVGYIYRTSDQAKQQQFLNLIHNFTTESVLGYKEWEK